MIEGAERDKSEIENGGGGDDEITGLPGAPGVLRSDRILSECA